MTNQQAPDPNALIMGSGARSAKFQNVKDRVGGTIVNYVTRQQTDINGSVKTYDDGNPMWQTVITLATELQEDDDDDGLRAVYAKGEMLKAIRTACVKAGATGISRGGKLAIQFTGERAPAKKGFSATKLFIARYEAPEVEEEAPAVGDAPPYLTDEDLPF